MGSSESLVARTPLCPLEADSSTPTGLSCSVRFLACVLSPLPREMTSRCDPMTKPFQPSPRWVWVGSHVVSSRFAQRSLTLRPAGLQPALRRLLSRQLRRVGCPSRRDDNYRDGSTVPRVGLAPTGSYSLHDATVESRGGAVPAKNKPVSTSRSSNWTCGFAASSSRTGFTSSVRTPGSEEFVQTDKPIPAI